jgi:hypothetical protein
MTFFAAVFSLGCGNGPDEQQLKEDAHRRSAEYAAYLALETEWDKATDEELLDWLSRCQNAVIEKAQENYKPYEVVFATSYSPDSVQASIVLAGGHIERENELVLRVKEYRSRVEEIPELKTPVALNSEFYFVGVAETFSGPQKIVMKGDCEYLAESGVLATLRFPWG